jgi:hypothetical protein
MCRQVRRGVETHRARSVGKPVQRSSPSLTGVIRWGRRYGPFETRTGACIDSRCANLDIIGARWPLTAGPSGLWSGWERDSRPRVGECDVKTRAPLAVVTQMNVWPAESLSLPDRPVDAYAASSSEVSGPGSFDSLVARDFSGGEWKKAAWPWASAPWPSPVSRREPRGVGVAGLDPRPSDVTLTLLRFRALAGKGLVDFFARILGAQRRTKHLGAACCVAVLPRVAVGLPRPRYLATWLILPVVICLSQRLSHACLSINCLYYETANGSLNQL